MFKLNQTNKSRYKMRKVLLSIAALLILCGAVAGYFLWQNKSDNSNKVDDSAQTNSAKKSVQSKNSNKDSNKTEAPNITKEEVPTSNELTVNITDYVQGNGNVTASAKVTAENGNCVFTYTTEGAKPVVTNSDINQGNCSASAPEVEFSKLGTWNLNVTAYVDDNKTEVNKSVTIN